MCESLSAIYVDNFMGVHALTTPDKRGISEEQHNIFRRTTRCRTRCSRYYGSTTLMITIANLAVGFVPAWYYT